MIPLNYCRDFLMQMMPDVTSYGNFIAKNGNVSDDVGLEMDFMTYLCDMAHRSQKFMLPDFGTSFNDLELRAISETEKRHLPFPLIALEYTQGKSKRIIFCEESQGGIAISPIYNENDGYGWRYHGTALVTLDNLRIEHGGDIHVSYTPSRNSVKLREKTGRGDIEEWKGAFLVPVATTALFLNALACSNVETEKIEARKPSKKSKGAAIPFDSYHILTVRSNQKTGSGTGGSHRSPREHLRRGHIRRLNGGTCIWVNACVVNAGIGARVEKDYRLAA